MPDGDVPSADLPVAEPTDVETRGGRSRARRSFVVAVVAVIAVAALAIPIALRASDPAPTHRNARRAPTRHVDPHEARIAVGAALAATVAAPSYHASSVMDVTAPPGTGRTRGLVIAAEATINRNPPAMYAIATVGGLGKIQSWTDGTRQWEMGGGNYGMTGGGAGPGQPISTFAGLVLGSLGPREGNVAMMSLASPSGYFDIADQAVTAASQVGTTTSDGGQLTEYDVTIDAAQMLALPGMTAEQKKTATTAFAGLQQEGYDHTTVRLGLDDAGFVRTAHMAWTFSDGGAVTNDATYSQFGCAGTVTLPGAAPAPPPVPTCTSSDTVPVTTAPVVTTPAPNTTVLSGESPTTFAPSSVAQPVSGTSAPDLMVPDTANPQSTYAKVAYAFGHFFDPELTADQRAALIQGSDAMRAFIDASFARHAGEAAVGAIVVDGADVQGDRAAVTFHALYAGRESPANPGQLSGTAVFEGGEWKISRDTFCTLSANDGEPCPPA